MAVLRKVLLWTVLVLLVASLGMATTRLRVATWAGAAEAALDEAIIAEFMRLHPEYEVIYEAIPGGAYYQKILTDIGAGTPPDVILLDAEMIPSFVEGRYLTDLAPFLARLSREGVSGTNLGEYWPVLVDIFRDGRSQYALPKDTSPVGIFFNKNLFDELGVPYPDPNGWTFEEFAETARLLTRPETADSLATWGFAFPSWVGVVVPILWAGGGEVFSPDFEQTSGYLNSQTNFETYSFFLDLLEKGYAPDPQEATALGGPAPLFYTGRVGMIFTGRWFNVSIRAQIAQGLPIRAGAATLPFADLDNKVTVTYASGWAVPSEVSDKTGAAMLAAWLASEYAQIARCLEGGLAISARQDIAQLQAEADEMDAVFISMLDFARVPVGSQTKFYRPRFESTWAEAFDRIYISGEPLMDVLNWAARTVDGYIERDEN